MAKRVPNVAKQLAEFPSLEGVRFLSGEEASAIAAVGDALEDLCKQVAVEESLTMTGFEFFGEGNDRGATFTVGGEVYLEPLNPGACIQITRGMSIDIPATNAALADLVLALQLKCRELKSIVAEFNKARILMVVQRSP